ncbi:MAG: DUF2065 domain-containing protein [Alphaproteobacteria bacterium]|nr:DUF2065 domain-containing protein [Alphaproteobacteria bacterium]
MQDFLAALALVLVIEGLLYAAAPDALRRAMAVILTQTPGAMRVAGLSAAVVGLFLLWLIRG